MWIWLVDPALADPALLPCPDCAGSGWLVWHGITTHINARYTLLLNNPFDLPHVAYVHASVLNFLEGEDPPDFDVPLSLRAEGGHLHEARVSIVQLIAGLRRLDPLHLNGNESAKRGDLSSVHR